ncbi:peptide ABC transporter substrate-binding protein [Bacillus anthracis]|nr:peptide ABC transporter substrate-binding protein [Bacillus anthracis]QBJ66180.1 peptide ABC transporter substrate-binding protein [Bacillus anthracis]THG56197.1 peptide ABC transporter substrate-binding protein [Bacillus sp. HUB-I-004]
MFNSKVVSAHHARMQGLQEDNYNGILLSLKDRIIIF